MASFASFCALSSASPWHMEARTCRSTVCLRHQATIMFAACGYGMLPFILLPPSSWPVMLKRSGVAVQRLCSGLCFLPIAPSCVRGTVPVRAFCDVVLWECFGTPSATLRPPRFKDGGTATCCLLQKSHTWPCLPWICRTFLCAKFSPGDFLW